MVGRTALGIPGAPAREVVVRFQTALVERLRAVLAFRAAEHAHAATDELRQEVAHWTGELRALATEHRLPFVQVCDALALGPRERDALALIAAPHLDDTFRLAIATYHESSTRRHVDAALVVEALCLSRAEAIEARSVYIDGGPLHVAGLIESVPVPAAHALSALEHELVPTPRLLRLLDAQTGLDPRFRGFATLVTSDPEAHAGVMPTERVDEIVSIVDATERSLGARRGASLLIAGADGSGKLRLARSIAGRREVQRLLVVDSALLPTDPTRLPRALEALAAEAELLGARLVLRDVEYLAVDGRSAAVLSSALRGLRQPPWLTSAIDPRTSDAPHLTACAALVVSIPPPDLDCRTEAWTAELRAHDVWLDAAFVRELATEYPLMRSSIEDVVKTFTASAQSASELLPKLAETRMGGQLGRFARRGRSKARLDHVVLPDAIREQIHELRDAVRNRNFVFDKWRLTDRHSLGRGIVALFNGPPGTGKTMTANVLANELGLPLYRIDTGAIVDRYVGETEKNLTRLFEEAAASRAALLFDEADSLFGKRVETQDSGDRYANMQINVLLNLIEDYDGFVVLTTNMKGSLDSAFLRRIVFKIAFELPDLAERIALWDYHLPKSIPRSKDVDLARLSRDFERVSGGDIKNAVLRAVLQAGVTGQVTHEILYRSIANELRANGSVLLEHKGRERGSSLV